MLVRNCSGGLVFFNDKVLLLKNDKHEWVFPKGVLREHEDEKSLALRRVLLEAGVKGHILGYAGKTAYEFYSLSRQRPVANSIKWYIMTCETDEVVPSAENNFIDGSFFPIESALEMVTYDQDKSMLMLAFQKYRDLI
ncbi:MAG: NUDIX domain-containing protein [Eubacteriales bacterium]|nr:NUDIX domain-containing protein [Eubacteriales bacterium]